MQQKTDQEERRTKMGYKIQLYDADNTTFKLKDGFVLKDELNETLDSGLITFFSTYSLDDIEPFDNVNISETNNTHLKSNKNILIDSYEEDITCFGSTFENGEYKYTMTLFSETKELERIVLPNCSTTQPINGGNAITVLGEIQRFVKLYGLKIKVGTVANFSYQPKYTLAAAVSTKFAGVKCPELQWNRPTLREVLNDLMSTKDCIVTLENNRIGLIDLSARGNQIDTTKLLYSKRSMSSQDYVGELSIDMQNAIGNNRTTVCEYISLRAPSGEATLTTENAVIRTQHPIYAIKKLEICGVNVNNNDEDNDIWVKVDFTNHICEKEEWELLSSVLIGSAKWDDLETFNGAYGGRPGEDDGANGKWKAHKVNKIYFERGKSEIKNIGTLYDQRVGAVGRVYFYHHVCISAFFNYISDYLGDYDDDPRTAVIRLEYETVVENSMNVGKYLPNHHPNNRTVDNQTNSYVDIQHQSVFEYAKANRLGNKIREVGGNYSNDNQIPKLGDRIGNEILFSRELCYWDNMVQFKGFLAPNYVLKDFYTGIAAKKRAWQIASESDALTRHDVYKLYVEASFKEKLDDWDTQSDMPVISISKLNNSLNVMDYLVSCFESYNSFGGIRYAVCSTKDSSDVYYPEKSAVKTMGIVTDTNVEIQGMSVCFNFGYEDNFKSAEYVVNDDNEYKQNFYAYADGNGEFLTHHIELVGDIWGLGDGINQFQPAPSTSTSKTLTNIVKNTSRGKPKIPLTGAEYNNMGLKMSFNVRKDNREIIKHTVQFEYCSDSENIIVGKKLIELSRLCNSNNLDITAYKFHWYLSGTSKYELGQEKDTGGSERSVTASDLVVETSAYSLAVTVNIPTAAIRWSITDANNNIILAVNGSQKTVFFNLLRDRDTNIYDSTDKKTIVGKLGD